MPAEHVDSRPGTGEWSDRAPGDGADADAPRCATCGRLLADPASKVRGLGPVCARRLGGRTAARASPAAPTTAPVPHIPGQTALPLQPFQPTLESL
ncbi:DUF6011 domain-containing protein [Streptomyces sp. NPDC056723]|uniref:DUF6011 domain-containing protein n=1 Tax=Streptomyces sp. NPDC056723 TaxID=3345925 RepID=UPI0036BE49E7